MKSIFFNRGKFSLGEILFVIIVSVFFMLIVVYDDSALRPNIELKTCLANMKKLHHATRLFIMEDPNIIHITPEMLLKKKYIDKIPTCPTYKDGKYVVSDEVGEAIDILCVHGANKEMGHGSFLLLKSKYIDKK